MTLTQPIFAFPDIFAIIRKREVTKAPDTPITRTEEADLDRREFLLAMAECPQGCQSEYGMMQMMSLYPGKF